MTNIYRITLKKKNDKVINFTSLDALFSAFTHDELGVAKGYVYQVFYKQPFYDNALIHIDKEPAFNKADVENGLFSKA